MKWLKWLDHCTTHPCYHTLGVETNLTAGYTLAKDHSVLASDDKDTLKSPSQTGVWWSPVSKWTVSSGLTNESPQCTIRHGRLTCRRRSVGNSSA